jgi:hypothetical protein
MSRVSGTTDTWQASISAPGGTIFRYFYNRNNSYNTPESYVPYEVSSPNTFAYRELIVRGGVTVSETVAKWKGIATATVSTGNGDLSITCLMGSISLWGVVGPKRAFC